MHTIVKLIDNTKQNEFFDNTYVEGYSHRTRLLFPNCGQVISSDIAKTGDIVFFYNYGMKQLDKERYCVPNANVFIVDNMLIKSGLIASIRHFNQGINFKIREQDFFYVEQTNCEIPDRAIVVCKSGTAYRYNDNSEKKYFIYPDNVLFYLKDEIKTTDDKMFLDKIEPKPFHKDKKLSGKSNNTTMYATNSCGEIIISGQKKIIVNKKDIYAYS